MSYATQINAVENFARTVKRNERGQNTLEFAFSFVILLMITLGLIDFGRAAYTKSVLAAASQEGARMGIVNIDESGNLDVTAAEDAVRARMFGLDTSNATINVAQSSTDVVDVTVAYNFRFVTPMVGTMLNAERGVIELVSAASMLRQ